MNQIKMSPLGPLNLLAKLVEHAYQSEISLHSKAGMQWKGRPLSIEINSASEPYLVLEMTATKAHIFLFLSEIAAVEIKDFESVQALLEKPWLKNSKNSHLNKLQFFRELESLNSQLPGIKIEILNEGFPPADDMYANLLVYSQLLVDELVNVGSSKLGQLALSKIKKVIVQFSSLANKCAAQSNSLLIEINLTDETFDKKRISALLNDVL